MYWTKEIQRWWKLHQVYATPEFKALSAPWIEHKAAVEKLTNQIPRQVLQESSGAQEFESRLRELQTQIDGLLAELASASPSDNEIKSRSENISRLILIVDEIFCFTSELSSLRPAWDTLKAGLQNSQKKLQSYHM